MTENTENQLGTEVPAISRHSMSDASIVRDSEKPISERSNMSVADPFGQLRRLRTEALRIASRARQKMTEALLVSEAYARAAMKFERRACDCEAEIASLPEPDEPAVGELKYCREYRFLADKHSHLASDNARRAEYLYEEVASQSAKAAQIETEISRRQYA